MPIQRLDIRSEETVSMNPMPLTKKTSRRATEIKRENIPHDGNTIR
jgi:hypothetical protein